MTTRLYHFDSGFSNYVSVSTTTARPLSCYNTSFPFKAPISKIKKISLKSAEIPLCFNNVRQLTTSGGFSVPSVMVVGLANASGGSLVNWTINLGNKHYTTITALIADVNTQFVAWGIPNGWTPVFSVSTTNPNRLVCTTTAPTVYFYGGTASNGLPYLKDYNTFVLGKEIMGFDGTESTASPAVNNNSLGYFTASNNFNLQPDLYLNMALTNVGGSNPNTSGILTTFKIPLTTPYNTIQNYTENNFYPQCVEIPDDNLQLTNLVVRITDRWGYDIDCGVDYSMTLEFETN